MSLFDMTIGFFVGMAAAWIIIFAIAAVNSRRHKFQGHGPQIDD